MSARDRELPAWRRRYRRQAARGFVVMGFGTILYSVLLVLFGVWA